MHRPGVGEGSRVCRARIHLKVYGWRIKLQSVLVVTVCVRPDHLWRMSVFCAGRLINLTQGTGRLLMRRALVSLCDDLLSWFNMVLVLLLWGRLLNPEGVYALV